MYVLLSLWKRLVVAIFVKLVQQERIELSFSAYEANVLPLHHRWLRVAFLTSFANLSRFYLTEFQNQQSNEHYR